MTITIETIYFFLSIILFGRYNSTRLQEDFWLFGGSEGQCGRGLVQKGER